MHNTHTHETDCHHTFAHEGSYLRRGTDGDGAIILRVLEVVVQDHRRRRVRHSRHSRLERSTASSLGSEEFRGVAVTLQRNAVHCGGGGGQHGHKRHGGDDGGLHGAQTQEVGTEWMGFERWHA